MYFNDEMGVPSLDHASGPSQDFQLVTLHVELDDVRIPADLR